MAAISLGFSPCPNDTFIFHALTHGLVDTTPYSFAVRLGDVETLNQLAMAGALDVTKVSYGALPYLTRDYVVLRSGGAMGRGCGPLIVAREQIPPERLAVSRIAIPGRLTTANLLLRLFLPGAPPGIEMKYDGIMESVARGEVDAGLIIHESRFTYPDHGLVRLVDMGDWWESVTGAPIPLGAIVARRSLGEGARNIEGLIRDSVAAAFANPDLSYEYVRAHAREMSPEVCRKHIRLYVNEFSLDVGPEGETAVHELMRRAARSGFSETVAGNPFIEAGLTTRGGAPTR